MEFYKKNKLGLGFTLVELLVVISIFTIITTALVINQGRWNQRLALKTASIEIGLILRQAQINSLAVREDFAGSGTDKFNVAYGVYFDSNVETSYIYFADRDGDSLYDSGEELSVVPLKNRIVLDRLCGVVGNSQYCTNSGLSKVVILFRRPESKATIRFLNAAGNDIASVNPPARIYIEYGTSRDQRVVTVQQNGQIDN